MNILAIAIGIQIVGFFIFYIFVKRALERGNTPDAAIEKVREELNSIMVEINRTTEQNVEIIEDKLKVLTEFLEKADKKLMLLQKEGEKRLVTSSIMRNVNRKPAPTGKKDKNKRGEVLRLYRDGLSPDEIAGEIGTTVGEVELIISMKNRPKLKADE